MSARFWMVYGLHQSPPMMRHKTEQSALNEAKRLARNDPDIEFFVLETTHHVVKRDVDVTRIETASRRPWSSDDDIPF